VTEPTQQRFEEALALLKSRVEDHYGISVRSIDVAAPFSGDLDGQEILHETGIRDLDQWLADLSASDVTYLEHYYATGIKGALADFRKTRQPLLDPLRIPEIKPQRLSFRTDGVVI
jgi:hypothetical protein